MNLTEDFIYQLKQANSIDSVMSSYVSLNRRGHNFVCLCPFHSEKSPSCTVYGDTQSFYCFGCGAGGDVITFVMKSENLEYIEAIRFLAQRGNIALPEDSKNDFATQIKIKVLEINRTAAKFFYSQLKNSFDKKGLKYFIDRGLTLETIKKYGLGYAEDKWNTLKNYLLAEGFSEDELITAGLCIRSKSGNLFDVFRNRVIFPIIDLRGNVIAFGGRLLDGEGPKYLNSSDTPVFKKSRNLFSLNFAKNSKEKRLILAEGYMDVIAVNQAGFENVIATLGTALTQEQARLMSQYADEIIIAYDSDDAGQNATYKAINLLSEVGVKTKIIKMQGAKDPDEYIKKFGATRFKLLLDNSEGAIVFELNKCKKDLDMDSDLGKIEYLNRAGKVLSDIENAVERDVYISRVSTEQNISKEILKSEVNSIISKRTRAAGKKNWKNITLQVTSNRDTINPDAVKFPKQAKAETGIIAYLFKHPDKAENISQLLPLDKLVTSFNKRIYENLIKKIKNSLDFSISSFNNEFSIEEMGKISEILAKYREIQISDETINEYIDVLLSHIDVKASENEYSTEKYNAEMSDDDFRDFFNNLKDKAKQLN